MLASNIQLHLVKSQMTLKYVIFYSITLGNSSTFRMYSNVKSSNVNFQYQMYLQIPVT